MSLYLLQLKKRLATFFVHFVYPSAQTIFVFRYFIFCILEIFKTHNSNCFLKTNHLLNLCTCVVNSQRLFCSQKGGVKCLY